MFCELSYIHRVEQNNEINKLAVDLPRNNGRLLQMFLSEPESQSSCGQMSAGPLRACLPVCLCFSLQRPQNILPFCTATRALLFRSSIYDFPCGREREGETKYPFFFWLLFSLQCVSTHTEAVVEKVLDILPKKRYQYQIVRKTRLQVKPLHSIFYLVKYIQPLPWSHRGKTVLWLIKYYSMIKQRIHVQYVACSPSGWVEQPLKESVFQWFMSPWIYSLAWPFRGAWSVCTSVCASWEGGGIIARVA